MCEKKNSILSCKNFQKKYVSLLATISSPISVFGNKSTSIRENFPNTEDKALTDKGLVDLLRNILLRQSRIKVHFAATF